MTHGNLTFSPIAEPAHPSPAADELTKPPKPTKRSRAPLKSRRKPRVSNAATEYSDDDDNHAEARDEHEREDGDGDETMAEHGQHGKDTVADDLLASSADASAAAAAAAGRRSASPFKRSRDEMRAPTDALNGSLPSSPPLDNVPSSPKRPRIT